MGEGKEIKDRETVNFYLQLERFINLQIKKLFPKAGNFALEISSSSQHGEFALTAALKLASRLGRSPLEVANLIKEQILKSQPSKYGIERVEVVPPGFLNFFLKREIWGQNLKEIILKKGKFFSGRREKNILIEFVSANPTGPLSVAHGRQAVVGDVLARIFEFCGYRVTREYYVNDEGRQIDLFVESVYQRMQELDGKKTAIPEGGYEGGYVKDIAREVKKEKGQVREDLRCLVLDKMLQQIREDLRMLGVNFDMWPRQSSFNSSGRISAALTELQKKGFVYEQEGTLWFRSTAFGDDKDRVVKRKDGSFTYFASDIAYHQDKMRRNFLRIINLWGPDHHGYIKRVKAAIKALGGKDILDILIIQLVNVKNVKMSKRAGTIVFLSELISEIGKDATRFFYLLRKNSSHLQVDIKQAKEKSMDNPLYYIQYAHARISSIIDKFSQWIEEEKYLPEEKSKLQSFVVRLKNTLTRGKLRLNDDDFSFLRLLETEEEKAILRQMFYFSNIVNISRRSLEPYFLTDYLQTLALLFHKFYERRKVIVKDNLPLAQARLILIAGIKVLIATILEILGITAVESM